MKRSIYVSWACLGLVVVFRLWNAPTQAQKSDPAPPGEPALPQAAGNGKSNAPNRISQPEGVENQDDKLVPRREKDVSLEDLGEDAEIFKRITSDPALIRILATYKAPAVGTVQKTPDGRFLFQKGDSMRFEAAHIGDTRSEAADGTVALEAITAEGGRPLREVDRSEDKVGTEGNPQEIWVITPKGRSERISPENMHAVFPIISPDGRHVAFTARSLVDGNLRSKVLLIRDRVNGKLSSYADRSRGFDYEIKAVDWVEDGAVLRVVEDWGETGGHINLKEIRVR